MLRALVGISESTVIIGSTVTINNWFPAKEKGAATGIFLASSTMGPLNVPLISAWAALVCNHPQQSSFVSKAELEYIKSGVSPLDTKVRNIRPFRFCWLDRVVRAREVADPTSPKQCFRCWDIYGAAPGYFFWWAPSRSLTV